MVGYRREAEEEGMAFLPTTSRHGAAAASTKRVAVGSWQNVLHCGRCVFLLRAHRSWWEDEAITADVLDCESAELGPSRAISGDLDTISGCRFSTSRAAASRPST